MSNRGNANTTRRSAGGQASMIVDDSTGETNGIGEMGLGAMGKSTATDS